MTPVVQVILVVHPFFTVLNVVFFLRAYVLILEVSLLGTEPSLCELPSFGHIFLQSLSEKKAYRNSLPLTVA